MSRQIILDTETTGLSADAGDRIIEIGCVELVNRKLTGNNCHYYLNPGRDSHEDALKVHGISNEFLRDKPRFAAVAADFLDYVRGAEIIIHNAAFDVSFLNKELELAGLPPFAAHVEAITDTLAMAKELYPGKRNSLDALCDRLGVDNSSRTLHGALLDAELLGEVYIRLTRGQNSLVMDHEDSSEAASSSASETDDMVDLSAYTLPVLRASTAELASHELVLADLDKASGGKTIWRLTAASNP